MKNLLFGLLILGSASSYAAQVVEFYDDQSGDLSAVISNPSLGDGILMYAGSSENGVCKALGYERAAAGSIIGGRNYRGSLVAVAENGSVSGGTVAWHESHSLYQIRQIICLNKISFVKERTHKVNSPLHLNSKIPFSSKSNENGVCKALGYDRGVVKSLISGWIGTGTYRGPMVVVDGSSSVTAGDYASDYIYSGYAIESLVCITNLKD